MTQRKAHLTREDILRIGRFRLVNILKQMTPRNKVVLYRVDVRGASPRCVARHCGLSEDELQYVLTMAREEFMTILAQGGH